MALKREYLEVERATNLPVTIQHERGETKVIVNQQERPSIDGLFHPFGCNEWQAGVDYSISLQNVGTDGYVIIDSLQAIKTR